MSAYKGMFEASVITVDESGESIEPYFDKKTLNSYIVDYFKVNLNKYTTDYTLDVNYPLRKTESLNTRVIITLKADINYFYKYENTKLFYIGSRDTV